MKKWAKIYLVAVLALAILPLANLTISPASHSSLSIKPHDANTYSKGDSIQVSESVSVSVNGKTYGTQSSPDTSSSGNFDELNTITVKPNSNSVTTMDKIFNSERLRFNGKTLVSYDPTETDNEKLSATKYVPVIVDTSDKKNSELVDTTEHNMFSAISSDLSPGQILLGQVNSSGDHAFKLVPNQNLEKYSVLLILVPIGGSVLVCSGNNRTAVKSRSVCSFVFIIILVASAVTTPMSISGLYVQRAFAESNNNTSLNLSDFSNSTQPLNLSAFSNSTQLNFTGFSNATAPILQIPNATKSWTFGNDKNQTTSVGDVSLQNMTNQSALSLQGSGYLTENLPSAKNLSHLTLSAWVKPDYTQGAPAFTIISAENQFALSINHIMPPAKVATFSIFDGIKWDSINSTVPISENWTHVAATFNGSSMQLYVNGTLASSLTLDNALTIQVDGQVGTKSVGNITSSGNLVIGAYRDSLRQKSENEFSGLISNVNLYESDFDAGQISMLYAQEMPTFYPALANASGTNMTAMIAPSINETQNSYMITQNPEFNFQYISDSNYTKIAHLFKHGNMTQYNGWHDSNTTINVQVVGPDGTTLSTKPTFKEIREGKFDISLPSAKATKPGLYKIKLTMTKNGKTYTTEEKFQWGLVSLNTQKSIYKPGELANLTAVVLDNGGHSVCNANITMRIVDPSGHRTTLKTGSGIVPELQCGLYDAQYMTTSAGNYTVHIVAQNPSGVARFATSFVAQNTYPFDIIRTTPSKIDPIDYPNRFHVRLDFGSYSNATNVSIQESVPSSFNVTTDGTMQTVGDSKILTWNRDMTAGNASVQYDYSVPLQYPKLYALGPAQISYGNGQTFTEARPWFVAVDPSREISVGSGTSTTSPLNFAITVPSSVTNTVGIVGVVVQSTNAISGITVKAGANSACSTGTQTFTLISGSQSFRDNNQIGLWNFTAPSTSDTNICVSWTGTASNVLAGFIAVNGTTAAGTLRQAAVADGTGVTKTTVTLSAAVGGGDIIVDAAADLNRTNAISPVGTGGDLGHTKLWGQNPATVSAAGGSKNATGADVLQWTPLVSGNTWLASAVAIERAFTSSTPSDTVSASEKTSTGQTAKDTIAVTENVSTGKNPSDVISVTDSPTVTTGTYNSVSVQDSIASQLSDTAEPGTLIRDSVAASDSAAVTTSIAYQVSVQDSIASQLSDTAEPGTFVQDSVAPQLSDEATTGNSVQDTVSVSDSTQVTKGIFNEASVQDSIASQLSDKIESGNSVEDTITVTDSPVATAHKFQQLSEPVSISDSVNKLVQKSITEQLSSSDSINTQRSKGVTDGMDIQDSVTSFKNLGADQQLVENAQEEATPTTSQPQLVIASSDAALSSVTISAALTNPSINYSAISSGGQVQLPSHWLNITKDTNVNLNPEFTISIPPITTISGGASWNSVLNLPSVISPPTTLSLPAIAGQIATPNTVLIVGASVPLQFNQPVRILLNGQAGLNVGYFYDPAQVTQITNLCDSDSVSGMPSGANECKINVGSDLVVWTRHFTGFATWSSSSASSGKSSFAPSSAGAGSIGIGPSGPSSTADAEGFAGILAPVLNIDSISYDMCKNDTVKILVEYSGNNPSVILRTSLTGIVQASPASQQPYAQDNVNATVQKIIYEAPIDPKEQSFEVSVLQAIDNNVNSIGQTIVVVGCQGTINFENGQQVQPAQADLSAPEIFDTQFQIANGTKIPSSESASHYVDNQDLTVYSIVNSQTPIGKANLMYTTVGQNILQSQSVTMNVVPLQISNTTYIVSGTIPATMMVHPAVNYWVEVQNDAGKTIDSDKYTIGVKSGTVQGYLELDTRIAKVEGSIRIPQAYFTNNGSSSVYGYVELLVDGKQVFASQPQVFGIGETQTNLQWKVPNMGTVMQHFIQARAVIYGQTFDTEQIQIYAFPQTLTIPLSKLGVINSAEIGNTTVADVNIIHSSFKHGIGVRYDVTAPDGTCVIGSDSKCLVTNSTMSLAHGTKIVTVDGQLYQVRYSGPNSPLERFSISSVDPIVGQWKVKIESQDPAAESQFMNSVFLQIKYHAHDLHTITAESNS